MDQIKEKNIENWYIKETIQNGLARPVIIHQIVAEYIKKIINFILSI